MASNSDALKIQQEYYREHLPFYIREDFNSCYSHKLYKWQKDFLVSRSLLKFCTAANQIGKSSIQIILCINMAVRKDLWTYYFKKRTPRTFIYCYPDGKLGTMEFEEKWVKEYLPRGKMKDDPRYGWNANYDQKRHIESIDFNSGVTVYFRFYSQAATSIQASTVDAVFLDEETPESHYDEFLVRTQATQAQGSGYVSMVFTATLGQKYLHDCMERQGQPGETFKGAFKIQISAFDCLFYADGTPSEIWTKEYIEDVLIPKYRNAREIQKRIYGRFVKTSGLIYEEFDMTRNREDEGVTDMKGWRNYVGVDYGSGGEHGHSSAIVIVKVDPTYSKARVWKCWSSQKLRMTQSDLLLRVKDMTEAMQCLIYGDWAATDLFELAAREGVVINKAEKSHEIGMNLLNTLMKEAQLKIIVGPNSLHATHLCQEMQSISEETPKRKRTDDLSDALRYALALCPMRLTALEIQEKKKAFDVSKMNPRLAFYRGLDRKDDPTLNSDSDDWSGDLDEAIDIFEGLL